MKKIIFTFLIFNLISCTPKEFKNLPSGLYAELQTDKGNILLELYFKDVPMTVANFVSLAEGTSSRVSDSLKGKNYFDGLTFHRVVKNFIIQGGDPLANGRGGPGYVFGDEFPKDSLGNLLYKHNSPGILSMANPGPNSNGSQFFITHRATPHLDNKHSVFGKIVLNSIQNELLQKSFKDSLSFKKSVDSLKMFVVNKIEQKDIIEKIKIIRVGKEAKSFEADDVFNNEIIKFNSSEKEREKRIKKEEESRYSKYLEDKVIFLNKMNESKAKKYDSGLGFLKLKDNSKGKKVPVNKPVKAHFILYTADGNKIQSTYESGQPFVFQLNDEQRPMITGFKEGVSKMKTGEKARLFIPYYIGFGEAKYGPFPAKSDLVFEVEILDIND